MTDDPVSSTNPCTGYHNMILKPTLAISPPLKPARVSYSLGTCIRALESHGCFPLQDELSSLEQGPEATA